MVVTPIFATSSAGLKRGPGYRCAGAAGLARISDAHHDRTGQHAWVAAILPTQAAVYLHRLATVESGLAFAAINPLVSGPLLADAPRRRRSLRC